MFRSRTSSSAPCAARRRSENPAACGLALSRKRQALSRKRQALSRKRQVKRQENHVKRLGFLPVALCLLAVPACAGSPKPVVVMETSLGTIKIELNEGRAPITVKNF